MSCIPSMTQPIGKDYIEIMKKKPKKKKSKSSKLFMPVLMVVVMLSLLLPLINAEESGGILIGKQNNIIILPQECASCTYVKLTTITYPNMSQLSIQTNMVKDGTSYSYNFNYTNQIGKYTYCMLGDVDGTNATVCKDFDITPTGYEVSTQQTTIMFFIVGIVLIVGLLFFIFGIKSELPYIRIFCLSISVILIVFLVGYIMNIANITIGEFTDLTNGFTPIYIIFISLLSVGGFGLVVYLIIFGLQEFAKHRGFKD